MSNAMSLNSRSYARAAEIAAFSERFADFSENPVTGTFGQISILSEFSNFRQSVFRAEFLQTMTKSEIEKHAKKLNELIESKHKGLFYKLSFHLQGDNTEKSSHIHLWGDAKESLEKIIQKYIFEAKLTAEENNNISYMSAGKKYNISENKIIEKTKDKDISVDSQNLFYEREKKEFDILMSDLDDTLQSLEFVINNNFKTNINYDDVDIAIVDEMLKYDIKNINIYEDDDEDEQ